jgi:RHS repeat-associated protein
LRFNDALGSVFNIVSTPGENEEAAVLSRQQTTAWGEDIVEPSSLTRYHFTQRERDDESDLMCFRARNYSPRLGRFAQKDPLSEFIIERHYAYADLNPIINYDPYGEATWSGVIPPTHH